MAMQIRLKPNKIVEKRVKQKKKVFLS